MAACFAENNGYGPTWDDGGSLPSTGLRCMLTWTDVLYDLGYVVKPRIQLCPNDERPDEVAEARGEEWDFHFVDTFGVGEPVRFGVRTSYALNALMHHNFPQDKFADASRQVYVIDGWWSWFGSLNACWLMRVNVWGSAPAGPVAWPHWQATMVGWRHGPDFSTNALYLDGHVALITPLVPQNQGELLRTVDTMESFTWLPGESTIRYDWDSYSGVVPEYQGRVPYWTDPEPGTFKQTPDGVMPIDYPEFLGCRWRTVNQAWVNLPADPANRY